ncbi:Ig-like domain-containing protein [Actinokineospora auranticolor]|uniref:Lipoprotein-anchoring transpeptidase ErfK/SrfK n=1 Tax=Actinokineospora auranticolor TaxID=155976 RepID=A0A2S6GUU0_9PSEU|nr:Ig-like domain-containing protein [Actinokineospora auranticolor]PPK68974.1 lipoprotein-anchoring transpeptidase ErfK/SrfK [Actinokineospora auranticolor]
MGAALVAVLTAAGCSSGDTPTPPEGVNSGTATASASPTSTAKPAPVPFALALTPADKSADVPPGDAVTVAATGGKLTEVLVTGADGKAVAGALAADGGTWQTTEALGYGKTYTTSVKAQDGDGKPATSSATFTTAKPKRQTALSMNPLDGQKVGVGQTFAFYFDATITDKAAAEKAIQVTASPVTEGAFYWFSDKEVHWRPREYWKSGTTVTVNAAIYGKNLGNGVFGREDRKATVTIGDSVVAVADGQTHQMTVTVNGTVARTIPISLGKKAHETPVGTYTVMSEHTNYVMDSSTYGVPADAAGGYRTKVAVASRMSNSGIFYHSAPWSVRDQGVRNVSHGCINMSVENAAWLQEISNKGDVIVVQNSGGPVLEAWDGLSVWQVPWETWRQGGKK